MRSAGLPCLSEAYQAKLTVGKMCKLTKSTQALA
jgi:hypothetical protein